MTEALCVKREIFIAASPETVFQFLVDPVLMARWIGRQHTLEPHPGGIFRVVLGAGAIAGGTYQEVSPPHRVAFTWGWEGRDDLPPGRSLVEIDLESKDGGTLVRLCHSGFPRSVRPPFTPEAHAGRWTHYLAQLERQSASPLEPEERKL